MVATQGAVIVSRPVLAHDQRKSYTINYPVGGRMSWQQLLKAIILGGNVAVSMGCVWVRGPNT